MSKKNLVISIIVALLIVALPFSVFAQDGEESEDFFKSKINLEVGAGFYFGLDFTEDAFNHMFEYGWWEASSYDDDGGQLWDNDGLCLKLDGYFVPIVEGDIKVVGSYYIELLTDIKSTYYGDLHDNIEVRAGAGMHGLLGPGSFFNIYNGSMEYSGVSALQQAKGLSFVGERSSWQQWQLVNMLAGWDLGMMLLAMDMGWSALSDEVDAEIYMFRLQAADIVAGPANIGVGIRYAFPNTTLDNWDDNVHNSVLAKSGVLNAGLHFGLDVAPISMALDGGFSLGFYEEDTPMYAFVDLDFGVSIEMIDITLEWGMDLTDASEIKVDWFIYGGKLWNAIGLKNMYIEFDFALNMSPIKLEVEYKLKWGDNLDDDGNVDFGTMFHRPFLYLDIALPGGKAHFDFFLGLETTMYSDTAGIDTNPMDLYFGFGFEINVTHSTPF